MRQDYGEIINISIYGESHSDEIGVVIEGLPRGTVIDTEELAAFMARRSSGGIKTEISEISATPRKEPDKVVFRSGVSEEGSKVTVTGTPVHACIYNVDRRSGDYAALRSVLRPGHADLGAYKKWGQEGLKPGSGRFSGRMTAPLCIAGGIVKQILAAQGITVEARYTEIGGETEPEAITEALRDARMDGDSLGGIIRCDIKGFPAGIGGPLFEGLEGAIAKAVFAIPAIKGIQFGIGFEAAELRGSVNNDEIVLENGELVTMTNNAGGINGGISNGMDITFEVAVKPTPTIGFPQRTVNIVTMEETDVRAGGRHDVCVVPRAVPVVEAAAALAIYDAMESEAVIYE